MPISPSSCNATPAASLSVPQLLSTGPMRSLSSEPWVCLHCTLADFEAAPGLKCSETGAEGSAPLGSGGSRSACADALNLSVSQPQGDCTDPAGISNSSAPSLSGVACALCLQQECTCESGMLQSTNASRLRELLKAAGSGPGQPGMDAAGDVCQAPAFSTVQADHELSGGRLVLLQPAVACLHVTCKGAPSIFTSGLLQARSNNTGMVVWILAVQLDRG